MLVLLNFVLPLFCISFVSGPRGEGRGRESQITPLPRPFCPLSPDCRTRGWKRDSG